MTSPFLLAFQPPPPPDPEERGLLRDIRDQPDADTPYRIYADWLEDHGDAYAAVVRGERLPTVVEALARLGGAGGWLAHLGYPAVRLEVRPHWEASRSTATVAAAAMLGPAAGSWVWLIVRRGFARVAGWPPWLWWAAGPQLLHDQPIDRVILADAVPAARPDRAARLDPAEIGHGRPLQGPTVLYHWQGVRERPAVGDPGYLVPYVWLMGTDPPEEAADGWRGYSLATDAAEDLQRAAFAWAQGQAAQLTCRPGPFTPDRWGEFPGGPIFPPLSQSPSGGGE